jgi:long-chain acyl-CoA synthetase
MLEPTQRDDIVAAVERLVAERPTAPLAISRTRRVTAGAVLGAAADLRRQVRACGFARHALLGMASANGPAFLATLLALRLEGHPVLLLDPAAPSAQAARVAAAMRAAGVLRVHSGWQLGGPQLDVERHQREDPFVSDQVAVVKLTSGSTGEPRGVATCAASLLADERALTETMGLTADDRLLAMLPFSHSYGFTTLVLTALVRGLPLIMPDDDGGPFAALTLGEACGATVFPTVPAYLHALLAMREPPPWPKTIRLVISAGALLPPQVAETFRRTYGQRVHTFYGSSECGGICYDATGLAAERGTVGRPVAGVEVIVESAAGECGPIVVRSAAVAGGYLPPQDDGRLGAGQFTTSDLGRWQDGEIQIRGRLDRLINVRGRKVDPGEVERVLRAVESVADAVVMAVRLNASDVPYAVVAPKDGAPAPSYERLFFACRQQLADYQVPRRFILVDRIAYTSRGKIDRAWLERTVANQVDADED